MEAVAAQPAFPGLPVDGEHLLDIGQGVVEGRVEARDLGQAGIFLQQGGNGFEREGLVQGRQRDVAAQVIEYGCIHAHRGKVLGTTMHHAVGHGGNAAFSLVVHDQIPDVFQCRMVGALRVEMEVDRGRSGGVAGGVGAPNAVDLAAPDALARHLASRGFEQGEFDAGGTAVQDEDEFAHEWKEKGTDWRAKRVLCCAEHTPLAA